MNTVVILGAVIILSLAGIVALRVFVARQFNKDTIEPIDAPPARLLHLVRDESR